MSNFFQAAAVENCVENKDLEPGPYDFPDLAQEEVSSSAAGAGTVFGA